MIQTSVSANDCANASGLSSIEGHYTGLCCKSAIIFFRHTELAAIRTRFKNHVLEENRFEIEQS